MDLKVKHKVVELLEREQEKTFRSRGRQGVLRLEPKAESVKGKKFTNWTSSKLKTCAL